MLKRVEVEALDCYVCVVQSWKLKWECIVLSKKRKTREEIGSKAYLRGEGNECGNGGACGNKKEKTQNDRRGIFLVSILK